MKIIDGLFAAIAVLLAPIINGATTFLGRSMPVDVAKALVVVGLLGVCMVGFKALAAKIQNAVLRISLLFLVYFVLTVGVIASDDHITPESFLFGPYVELMETYF